jgi:hypothetical protein
MKGNLKPIMTMQIPKFCSLFQFSATVAASWTCISHGLLTGYTAQGQIL